MGKNRDKSIDKVKARPIHLHYWRKVGDGKSFRLECTAPDCHETRDVEGRR